MAEQELGHPPLTALVEDDVELTSTELWEFAKQLSLRRIPRRGTLRRRQHLVYQYWAQNGKTLVTVPEAVAAGLPGMNGGPDS